jgi:carbon storage regulator CsrA
MLVLSRKINETIIISEDIRITLTMIRGQHVRIAIEAPKDIPILRGELLPKSGPAPKTAPPLQRASRRTVSFFPDIAAANTPRKP